MDTTQITNYLESSKLTTETLELYSSVTFLNEVLNNFKVEYIIMLTLIIIIVGILLAVVGLIISELIPAKTRDIPKEIISGIFLSVGIGFFIFGLCLAMNDYPKQTVALVVSDSEPAISGYYEFYTFEETKDSYVFGIEDEYTINKERKVQEPLTFEIPKEGLDIELVYTPDNATFGELLDFQNYIENTLGN